MTDIFTAVLNMSLTAAFVIAALCLARLVLRKIRAPKWISYALWAVAGFRLAVPFTLESVLSLLPHGIPEIAATPLVYQALPSGIIVPPEAASQPGSSEWMQYIASSNSPQITPVWSVLDTLAAIWLIGIALMFLYSVISYVRLLRHKDSVTTPFIYGFIKPKIHIPCVLAGDELHYAMLHEQTHIIRRDYLVKLFAFALLCVHWFNPLAWVAFVLLCADMEMSCDERVLRELGMGAKADYSQTLLSLSANRRILNASPLAFGESGIKERVKNVLNFRKPSRVIIIAALALAIILSAGFAVNRATDAIELPDANSVLSVTIDQFSEFIPIGEVTIVDSDEINHVLNALSGASKRWGINGMSVNDRPIEDNYLLVRLNLAGAARTFFLYTDVANYIEEPYVGIYRSNNSAQFNYIYSIYAAHSIGLGVPTEAQENIPHSHQEQTAIVESLCPYTSFTFWTYWMRTVEDSAFTAEIWNAVRYDEWTERDGSGDAWESSEKLVFRSLDEYFYLRIIPTDEVQVLKYPPDIPGYDEIIAYYNAPSGTYNAITALLSDYTTNNLMYEINLQILSDLLYSSEDLRFIQYRNADYFVLSSSVGYFMDEWDLENWEEFDFPDWSERLMDERVIRIHSADSRTQIEVYLDFLDVTVYYEWGAAYYEISQDTADTILRQFMEFQELAFLVT